MSCFSLLPRAAARRHTSSARQRLFAFALLALGLTAAACEPASEGGTATQVNPSAPPDAGGIAPMSVSDAAPPSASMPAPTANPVVPSPAPASAADAGADAGLAPVSPRGDAAVMAGDGAAEDGGAADPRNIGLAASGLQPFPTNGTPLDVKEGAWTYVEFPDAYCRSGSKAGVSIFRNKQSKKVMFFFEGGGACFDEVTCLANPDAIGEGSKAPSGGILDRSNAQNPVKDWNFVYLPYCTGDVFAGTNPNASIGGTPQKFVGYLNTKVFLQRLVPTFADATDVLVTGVSAGGFGAAMNAALIQRAFPWVKAKAIDDSGPPMPSSALATCLQKKWRETWGFDQSILAECGSSCANKDDYTMDYGVFLAKNFNDRLSGLIEAQEDFVISGFFGAGLDIGGGPCSGIPLLTAVPSDQFKAGLLAFREAAKSYKNFGTYYPPGGTHTFLQGPDFYTTSADGVSLLSWVSDIINDRATSHVGK